MATDNQKFPIKEYILPAALCLINISIIGFLFWPGYLSPDSTLQLNQALTGHYSDGHPPMMSFLWKIFHLFYPGAAPYLLFHLSLFFFSFLILLQTTKQIWLRYIIAFLPLIPHISAYAGAIWKDVGFAYSFLLAAMILVQNNLRQEKLSFFKIGVILLLLIYGVGVKYQGQFIAPLFCIWLGLSYTDHKLKASSFGIALFTALFVILSVLSFNKALVPVENQEHFWQRVKLYDIAGISIRVKKNLFPDFISSAEPFSMEKVEKEYSPKRVDELLDGRPEAPLILAKDKDERKIIWDAWAISVIKHPFAYLSHRLSVSFEMMSRTPIKPIEELKNAEKIPQKIRNILENSGGAILSFARELTRFIYMFPFIFLYIIWGGFLYRQNNPYGLPLLMMNLAAFFLIAILFIFSMAADLRYIYLSTCLVFFSHPLAIGALLSKSKQSN